MDQAAAKRTLQELIKNEELGNKKCIDCSNPNPQWASVSFAVFLCLQCAGIHRGFGVHISFVRSVSMDTWQEDQIRRMQLGGNAPFKAFIKSYPAAGGYKEGMGAYETYHCWAASQYREKLDADLAEKSWSPSSPPANATPALGTLSPPGRPSSVQGLRKSRASTRDVPSRSASPASFNNAPIASSTSGSSGPQSQKEANESYFSGLGQANAARPDNLPPSQGGKYQGFGNTPSPSAHPSYGLSSAAAPSLTDFQEDPMAALGKGWSLFSAAISGASRVVQENVIQPGMEKVMDPNFQSGVRGYVSEASKRAGEVAYTANTWTKHTLGVDVAGGVGGVVDTVRERVGGGPQSRGYGMVNQQYEGETTILYQDNEDDDFFGEYAGSHTNQQGSSSLHSPPRQTSSLTSRHTSSAKKNDDWDEWKDF